jgi:hypothetical protein
MRALLRSISFLVIAGTAGCFALFPLDEYQSNAVIDAAPPPVEAAAEAGPSTEAGGFDPNTPHHHFFITSATFHGDFGGIDGATSICNQLAQQAGRTTTFIAVVSTSTAGFLAQFTAPDPFLTLPIADYANQLLANDINDLFTNGALVALDHTETGAQLELPDASVSAQCGPVIAWTDTNRAGTSATADCNSWQSGGSGANGIAGSPFVKTRWSDTCTAPCNTVGHLYCIEK